MDLKLAYHELLIRLKQWRRLFEVWIHCLTAEAIYTTEVFVRFLLILVSLFYVEVSVTRPVFHIWYCTRGFLFRLNIVLPPS